jgi:hypothetical protein
MEGEFRIVRWAEEVTRIDATILELNDMLPLSA